MLVCFRRQKFLREACLALICLSFAAFPVQAFPPYAKWITKKSGVTVDCSYCHINSQGPMGNGIGQVGALTEAQSKLLNGPDSPILNAFGKSIIKHLGYQKVVSGISNPETVADAMKAYDLDGDGISDGSEMEYGTLADDPDSAPAKLVWLLRLKKHLGFIASICALALLGAFGFWGLSASGELK